jgi:dTDP-L-rhamnose 4-epimerase
MRTSAPRVWRRPYGRGMRILVTGGLGFIGGPVCAAFDEAGHEVVVLDAEHPAAHREPVAECAFPLIRADVRDRAAVDRALRGVDVVVHQAALVGLGVDLADLPEYVGCNDLGTAVLLAAMASQGIRRLVLASSMVVYGEGGYRCADHQRVRPAPRLPDDLAKGRFEPGCPRCGRPLEPVDVDEDDPLEPRSVYAATKVAQEHLAAAWADAIDGSVVALRYHNVYGPGMPRDTPYSGVAAIFRSALEAGRPPAVFEDGEQRRDFVHVSDVARANVLAAGSTGPAGLRGFRGYNVASGRVTSVGSMASALAQAMDGPAPVVTGAFRAGDVRHVTASPARARMELGFAATVGLEDGLREFATAALRA